MITTIHVVLDSKYIFVLGSKLSHNGVEANSLKNSPYIFDCVAMKMSPLSTVKFYHGNNFSLHPQRQSISVSYNTPLNAAP